MTFHEIRVEKKSATVQVLTAVAGSGKKCLRAVESKRLSKEEIAKVSEGKLAEGTILMTEKHPSYKAYAKQYPALKHKALLAKDHAGRKDSPVHLQGVRNTHSQLRKFLTPLNGVRTKYLQNYLNRYAYKGEISKTKTPLKQWFIVALMSDQAYNLFWLFKQNAVIIRT